MNSIRFLLGLVAVSCGFDVQAATPVWTSTTVPTALNATGYGRNINPVPAFVDIDGDGDKDVFIGLANGTIEYYRNSGTATNPLFTKITGAANPFNGVDVGSDATITFLDVDGDGKQDALLGHSDGSRDVRYYRNTGTVAVPAFTRVTTGLANYPFITASYNSRTAPAVGDINNDGKLDVVIALGSTQSGTICTSCRFRYFVNTTGNVWVEQTGAANPFSNLRPTRPIVSFADIDSDGKTDFVLGNSSGQLLYYRNTSATTTPVFAQQPNYFSPSNSVSRRASPFLIDLDGDGAVDVVTGFSTNNSSNSGIRYFRNAPPPPAQPGRFNAVDVGANAVTGPIQTKVSATPYSLDLIALDVTLTAPLIAYNGTVRLELMDALDDTGAYTVGTNCRTTWVSKQTIGTYPSGPMVWSSGRMTVSGINYTNVLRRARMRITDTVTGISGCSYDAFAIRPAYIRVNNVTDANSTTAGTTRVLVNNSSPTGAIVHVAGEPFTVQTDARNAVGTVVTAYAGAPDLTASALVADGNTLGNLTNSGVMAVNGVVRDDDVTYDEVGVFVMQATDASFASFTDGPAIDGTPLSQLTVPAEASVTIGRFVPGSFDMTSASATFNSACSGFTYLGQPFGWLSPPTIVLTPLDANGGSINNYVGNRVRLTSSDLSATPTYSVNTGTINVLGARTKTVTANADGTLTLVYDNGQTYSITRPAAPVVPSNREIALSLSNVTDKDGVAIDPLEVPVTIGTTAVGGGIGFGASGTDDSFRFGQMRMVAASGPNTSALDVPLRVEYWTSGGAFAQAADDTCTTGVTPNPVITAAQVTLNKTALVNTSAIITVTPQTIVAGSGALRLSAPSPSTTGRVTVLLDLSATYPWLGAGTTNFISNICTDTTTYSTTARPLACATFGTATNDNRRYYLREYVR